MNKNIFIVLILAGILFSNIGCIFNKNDNIIKTPIEAPNSQIVYPQYIPWWNSSDTNGIIYLKF